MHPISLPLATQKPNLNELIQRANDLIQAAKAESTRKAYRSDWLAFEAWFANHLLPSLPSTPEAVALYITSCVVAQRAPTTIARRLAAITKAHQAAGYVDSPASAKHFVVGEVLKGARRTLGVAQKCKDALLADDIRRIVAACPASRLGQRDRALVLVGFAGAFRRSELAAIYMPDLTFRGDSGLVIHQRHSKTDQEGAGREVAIPFGEHMETCPVIALQNWLAAAAISRGAVFRGVDRHGNVSATGLHPDSIGTIPKNAAARAAIDATNIAGHSIRAGMATQAAMNGASERDIAKTTGHKSRRVLRRYIRTGRLFHENASASLGL